jgi:signal transduction histidine kinase
MRPDQTRQGGLALALSQLAERSTISGRVALTFEGAVASTGLPPEHEHALLRIAQEAVSNAVRHAQPSHVKILLTEEPLHWELAVVDDGHGMEDVPEECAKQGFGLANMRERAHKLGGEWLLESAAGQGTRIRVRLPKRNPK